MRSIASPLDGVESPFGPRRRARQETLALLQQFSGAAAAYSLRDLAGTNPNVVRVRRSSDNAEKDFTAVDINDGSLEAWVGVGNDGFVPVWYDVFGSRNATQSVASLQYRLVNNGALETINGKPTLKPASNGSNYEIPALFDSDISDGFMVLQHDDNDMLFFGLSYLLGGVFLYIASSSSTSNESEINRAVGNPDYYVNNLRQTWAGRAEVYQSLTPDQKLLSFSGVSLASGDVINRIGPDDGRPEVPETLQEIIIYPSDQSTSRAAIESNINNHYGIY